MSRKRAPARTLFALVAFGLVAAAAIYALAARDPTEVELASGIALPQPRKLPDFQLVNQHARSFGRADLEGGWTLLFAGFTHCPDICPTTLATLAAIDAQLRARGVALDTVFLSLDPERDTPATLAPYLAHFNPQFIGATGPQDEIARFMAGLGLAYIRVPTGGDGYTIDHSAALVLIDPRARVAAYFKPPLVAERIAADLATLAGPRG